MIVSSMMLPMVVLSLCFIEVRSRLPHSSDLNCDFSYIVIIWCTLFRIFLTL